MLIQLYKLIIMNQSKLFPQEMNGLTREKYEINYFLYHILKNMNWKSTLIS